MKKRIGIFTLLMTLSFYGCIDKKDTIVNLPELNLKGESSVVVIKNGKYIEPGYSATDKEDGDISEKIEVITTWNGDTTKEGIYEILYRVKDSDNNESEKKRVITVKTALNVEKYENGIVKYAKEGMNDGESIAEYERYENGNMKSFKRTVADKLVEECSYNINGIPEYSKYYDKRVENYWNNLDVVYEFYYDTEGNTLERRVIKNGEVAKIGSYVDDKLAKDTVYKNSKVIKEIEYYPNKQLKKYTVYDDNGVKIFEEEYAKEDFTGKSESEIISSLLPGGYDVENEVETPAVKKISSGFGMTSQRYSLEIVELDFENWKSIAESREHNLYRDLSGFERGNEFIETILNRDMYRRIHEKNKFVGEDVWILNQYSGKYRCGSTNELFEKKDVNIEEEKFDKIYGKMHTSEIFFGIERVIIFNIKNLPEDKEEREKYICVGKILMDNIVSGKQYEIPEEYKYIEAKIEYEITAYLTGDYEKGVKINSYEDIKEINSLCDKRVFERELKREYIYYKIYDRYWI